MAVRLSRRAGPEHPMLFDPSRDIPWPPRPPALPPARAESDMAPFRDLLAMAETVAMQHLTGEQVGRPVTVAGARLAADPLLPGDALLDDGSAVMPIVLESGAPGAVRAALGHRFIVASGIVGSHEGFVTLIAHELRDLRQLDREWRALARR